MKKIFFLLLILVNVVFGETTNDQILKKLNLIEHNQELIKQEMRLRFEAIDKRFEAIDKRFEAIDKRFESIDKRFESIDKRFEIMNENFNNRFETLTNFIITLTAGIFGLIGFMMWDRKTTIEKAKKECVKEIKETEVIAKKIDKEYMNKLIKAMSELLVLKDKEAENVFKKYGLI